MGISSCHLTNLIQLPTNAPLVWSGLLSRVRSKHHPNHLQSMSKHGWLTCRFPPSPAMGLQCTFLQPMAAGTSVSC